MSNGNSFSKEYITFAFFKILETKRFEEITIGEICEKAGVSRVTYYRNFQTKLDIIKEYFQSTIEKFTSNFGKSRNLIGLEEIAYHAFKNFKNEMNNLKSLEKNGLIYLYMDLLSYHFSKSFKENEYGSEASAYIFAGALYNLSMWWMSHNCQDKIESVMEEYFKICNYNMKK